MALIIDLQLQGKGAVQQGLGEIGKALQRLENQMRNFAQAVSKVSAASAKGASNISRKANAASRATGVMSRLIKAQKDYNDAVAKGDKTAVTDSHDKLLKAQRAFQLYQNRADASNRSPLQQAIDKMLGTSRMGMSGGKMFRMPLQNAVSAVLKQGGSMDMIKNLMGDMGGAGAGAATGAADAGAAAGAADAGAAVAGGAAGGPVGIIVALAALALVGAFKKLEDELKKFAEMVIESSEKVGRFGSMATATNATPNTARQLGELATAIGSDAQSMGKNANSFADAISHGGYGQAYANDAGIYVSPNEFERSQTDVAEAMVNAAKRVLTTPDEQEARVLGHLPGMEDVLNLRENGSQEEIQTVLGRLNNPSGPSQDQVQAATDFNTELAKMAQMFDKLKSTIATPFEKIGTLLMRGANGVLGFMDTAARFMLPALLPGLSPFMDNGDVKKAHEATSKANDAVSRATKENTDAIINNTRALKDAREVLGGGDRSRAAIPAGWRYLMGQEAMHAESMRLGAF